MKRGQNLSVIATAAFCALAAACFNPFSSGNDSATGPQQGPNAIEHGSLTVTAGDELSANTVVPPTDLKSLAASYRVAFSDHSDGQPDFTEEPYTEGESIGPVAVGEWTVTVVAIDAGGNEVAMGVPNAGNPVSIRSGSNSTTVTLRPIAGSGDGRLTYSIACPPGEGDEVTVTMDPLPVGGGDAITLTAGTDYNSGFATSGTLAIDTVQESGEYLLSVVFSKMVDGSLSEHPPISEVVHLFDNLTSSESVSVTSEDFTQPPAAPTDLGATSISGTEIQLTWTDTSVLESGFEIERAVDSEFSSATTLAVGANETSYTDTTLPVDGTWYYRIAAGNTFGASDPSTATSTEIVFAPTGLAATATSSSTVDLEWTDNSSVEEGFKIERKLEGGSFAEIDTVTADAVSYSDVGLAPGSEYSYQVRAHTASTNSTYCSEASVQTLGSIDNTIMFEEPNDETIVFNQSVDQRFSPFGLFSVVATDPADAESWSWYLDGDELSSVTNTVEVDCLLLDLGVHHLTCYLEVDGAWYSDCLRFYVSNSVGGWRTETVVSTGTWGSLVVDATDTPYFTYRNDSHDLEFARWDGSDWVGLADPASEPDTIDTTNVAYTSIDLDASGYPHISYYSVGDEALRYARWNGSDWGGLADPSEPDTVDSDPDGIVGNGSSLAVDGLGYPHIAYLDSTNGALKYVRWNGSSWVGWANHTGPDTVDGATDSAGGYRSIALDDAGFPHICYYHSTDSALKYARWDGYAWVGMVDGTEPDVVDSVGSVGRDCSLALDSSGYPHISYSDVTNETLKYVQWDGTEWGGPESESAPVVVDSSILVRHTSIVVNTKDEPHIAYGDDGDDTLKYARWDGSAWVGAVSTSAPEVIESATHSFGQVSLSLDSSGRPRVGFRGVDGSVKYAMGSIGE